jgi:hypothetical protein
LEIGIGGKSAMLLRIDRAIKRNGKGSVQLLFQPLEHGAASKAEVDVQFGEMLLEQVIRPPMFPQIADRDGRINVIKGPNRYVGRQNFLQRGNAVREIRTDHGNV